ncbi:MAG: hypothetical protein KQ78_01253 [Candidatus Izimaplasma bacterium HR2]|nr:MAG: hypothetical protein KQ78_01253 [Candidatus Izimaplasma bacterium HR2]
MGDNKDNTNKIMHLNMIQEVIGRFSKNSFTIKSWNITLLTAFIAYGLQSDISEENILIVTIAFTLGFMFLDWYYLNLEKSYRNLYKAVNSIKDDSDIDFSMEFHRKTDEQSDYKVNKTGLLFGISRPIIYMFYGVEIVFLILFLII